MLGKLGNICNVCRNSGFKIRRIGAASGTWTNEENSEIRDYLLRLRLILRLTPNEDWGGKVTAHRLLRRTDQAPVRPEMLMRRGPAP